MRHMPHTLYHSAQYNWLSALLDVLVRLTDQSRVTCMLGLSPPVSPSLGNRGLGIPSCMRGKQSGPEAMEEPRRACDTNPRTTALEPEPGDRDVTTDVSHG